MICFHLAPRRLLSVRSITLSETNKCFAASFAEILTCGSSASILKTNELGRRKTTYLENRQEFKREILKWKKIFYFFYLTIEFNVVITFFPEL